jgi:hypothetical protein
LGKPDEAATTRRARRDAIDHAWCLAVVGVGERDANMTREARRAVE